eukprot:TRINITY_DN1826_c0_g1_i5.p1 TRINITY_DN1826_c0_g1~~TRINITY_DN1826_c0_g1_i5.p1  ORF type:complete len:142 (+),score=18.29 TRINITY_DN1826_c0_g1_i5:116-541(+)
MCMRGCPLRSRLTLALTASCNGQAASPRSTLAFAQCQSYWCSQRGEGGGGLRLGEQPDDAAVPLVLRVVARRVPLRVDGLEGRVAVEQRRDERRLAVARRQVQRRHALVVLRGDVRARLRRALKRQKMSESRLRLTFVTSL